MTRLKAGRARPATNRPGASTSPLPDRVRPLAEASGPTLNAGEVVCRLRDFRIVAGGHRIEQPRLCAVDVIGRALPHRLPGSVCPFQLSPPGSPRVPPRISETKPNPAESPPALYQPRQNGLHPVRVLFSWNRAGKRPRHVTRATGGHRRRFHAAGRCVPSSRRALTSRAPARCTRSVPAATDASQPDASPASSAPPRPAR